MGESYRVAVLGSQDYCYGLQVFDLTVDQICSLLENPDEKGLGIDHKKLGAEPDLTCQVMGGGRYFPSHARKEIAEMMQGVEILIAVLLTEPHSLYFARNFYASLIEEYLTDDCEMVIARIVDNYDGSRHVGKSNTDLKTVMHRYMGRHHMDFTTFENLQSMGFYCVLKVPVQQPELQQFDELLIRVRRIISSECTSQDLALVRAALVPVEEELTKRVTQPVKETLSAGKRLLDAGQRLSGWIGSHIKTPPAA